MECGRCAGFWMGANMLERLVKKAEADQPLDDFCFQPEEPRPPDIDPFKQRGPLYRKCPICGKLMSRRNYARHSGVIIDVCRQHGVWFDADELPRILAWVRAGKKAEADRREAHEAEHQKRLEAIAKEAQRQREWPAMEARPGTTAPIRVRCFSIWRNWLLGCFASSDYS